MAGPWPSMPLQKVATRVMSVWKASKTMSYIVRRKSPICCLDTFRFRRDFTPGSTSGRGTSSHLSARSVRTSTSRTEVRYCSSRPRSSWLSCLSSALASLSTASRMLPLRWSPRRCLAAPPFGSSNISRKTTDGLPCAGNRMPSAFHESDAPCVVICNEWKRVCGAVHSAISWSTEIVLRSAAPSLPPVSQIL